MKDNILLIEIALRLLIEVFRCLITQEEDRHSAEFESQK